MKKIKEIFTGKGKDKHTPQANAFSSAIGYTVKEKDLPKFHKAAWNGDLAKVKQLTKKEPNQANAKDKENRTALHLACAAGHSIIVQELLACHAMVDSIDSMFRTPLMKATECSQEQCVEVLLKFKPNLIAKDKDHNTALHIAVQEGHANIALRLINAGADLNAKNKDGQTPLIISVLDHTKRDTMTRLLLDNDADPNQVDNVLRSALHHACITDALNHVKLLLTKNASTTLKDAKGWTAEDCALINKHHGCSQMVYDYNIKLRQIMSGSVPGSGTPRVPLLQLSSTEFDRPQNSSGSFPGQQYGMPQSHEDDDEDSDDQTVSKTSGHGDKLDSWADDTDISSAVDDHRLKGVPTKTSLKKHLKIEIDEDSEDIESETEGVGASAIVNNGKSGDFNGKVRSMYSRTPTPDADLRKSPAISTSPNKYIPLSKTPPVQYTLPDRGDDITDDEDEEEIPIQHKNIARVSFSKECQVKSATDVDTDIEDDEDEEVEPTKKRRIETPDDHQQLDEYLPPGWTKKNSNNLSKEQFKAKMADLGFDADDVTNEQDPESDENDSSSLDDPVELEIASGSKTSTPRSILKKSDVGKPPSVLQVPDSDDDDSEWDTPKQSATDNLARSIPSRPDVNSPEVDSDIEAFLNPENSQVSQVEKTSYWDSTDETCSPRTPRNINGYMYQNGKVPGYKPQQEVSHGYTEAVTSFNARQEIDPSPGAQSMPTVEPHIDSTQSRAYDTIDAKSGTLSALNHVISAGKMELERIVQQSQHHLDSVEDSDWDSEKEDSYCDVDAGNKDVPAVVVTYTENSPRTVIDKESISEWKLAELRSKEAAEKGKVESQLLIEMEEEEERQKNWEVEQKRRQSEAEEELRKEQMSSDSDISDFSDADGVLPNSARQQEMDHYHHSQVASESSEGSRGRSHQSDNSKQSSQMSPRMRELKKSPPKLVVKQFFNHSASTRDEKNPVQIGEIENESPAPDNNNVSQREPQDHFYSGTHVVSSGGSTLHGSHQYKTGQKVEQNECTGIDDGSGDEVSEDIYDDNEQVEEVIKVDTISRHEARIQGFLNSELQFNEVKDESKTKSPLLGTPPPLPSTSPPQMAMSPQAGETSIDELDASASLSYKKPPVTAVHELPEISGATGLYLSGLDIPFDDDGLSVTSTENGDISSSYRTEQLPYGKDVLVNMNLNDSGAVLKLQEHLREHRKQLEYEQSRRQLLESQHKQMINEREEMQKTINNLKTQKSVLDQHKLDLEEKIRNLEYSVNDELEKKKNAETLLKKTKEQLAKKEEQYTQEMEAKQKAELSMRNVQLELRSAQNQLKELEAEKEELERLLVKERNARQLHEKISDEQQRLQQHMHEESIKASSQQELADDDVKLARDLVEKYGNEISALKAELQKQRTRLTEENTILLTENEKLQQHVDDLRNEVKIHQDALTTYTIQQNMLQTKQASESATHVNNLEKEQEAREKVEVELESYRTRLQSATSQLERTQQARNDLERRLQTDHEEWDHQLERKEQELSSVQEKLATFIHAFNASETKLNSLENEVQISNTTLLERTNQYHQAQRELQHYKSAQDNFDSNYKHEKEQNIKLTAKIESLQDRLSTLQHDNLSLKQQVDIAQQMANERSGFDLQDKLNTMIATLKADHDKARALLDDKNNHLQDTISHLREEVRNSENRRSSLEQDIRHLNQEHNELVRKLSMSEASLDVSVKAREHLEQERVGLKMELEKLQQKYHMAQEKTIESQTRMNELMGRLDRIEESRMHSKQQLADTSATMQAFTNSKQELEENYQKIRIENIRLEAELKSEKQKTDMLQRDLADSQKVRSSLEALCSNLKSTNAHLEEKLGPDQLLDATASGEVSHRNMILKDMEDHKGLWEQEVIMHSKLGMRLAQLDRQKHETAGQLEEEKRKTRKALEQKKVAETKLGVEQEKCNSLQKEVGSLKAYLKVAKKKLKEQGIDDVLDTSENRFNNMQLAFDKERQALEEMVVSVKSQLEHMKIQLEDEIEEKERLHQKNIQLETELKTVKKLEFSVKKIDCSKRKLEEEFRSYKNTVETGYTNKESLEVAKKEIETRYRLELNRKLDEVNNYLEEQACTRQRLDLNRDEQENKLRNEKKRLEDECTDLRIKYEHALAKLETAELEARRFHDLYESEMQWRQRLSEQLYRSTDKAFEFKNKLVAERQKNRMYGSLSNLTMNGQMLDLGRINGTLAGEALSNRLKGELDRSIAKHLEAAPHDHIRSYVRNDDAVITTSNFTKASADYHEVLKRKFCV